MPYETANARKARSMSEPFTSADDGPWQQVELFPTPALRVGSRFDDTVALPIDTPRRLDEAISTASRRLKALPEPRDLGHRSILYRARLQRLLLQALQARNRLAAGNYGTCIECSGPISLAILAGEPWTPLCINCALDI